MKRIIAVILGVAVLGGGAAWLRYGGKSKSAQSPPPAAAQGAGAVPRGIPVKTGPVKVGKITEEITAVGSVLANEGVMIRPEIDGRIAGIHFQEGQPVGKGAKLVSLDASETEAQLAAVRSELSLNRSRLARAEELEKKNFISMQALDEARQNLNSSLAREAEIVARLAKSVILAPFDGVAGVRQVSPGAYVKAGQDIARLEGIGTVKVDFRVPEVYLGRVRAGQEVSLRVDAYPEEVFSGSIYAVEPAVEESSRTVLARARMPNLDAKLRPGMFARVGLVLGERDNTLLVPEQAIVPRGRENFVYRVVDGKAALTQVTTGYRIPGEVEIVAGLSPSDVVVTDGQLKLQDGTPVSPLGAPPPAAQGEPPKAAAPGKPG